MTQRHPTMLRREGRDRFVWVLPHPLEQRAAEPVLPQPFPNTGR